MKKHIALFALVAAALVAAPSIHAQDTKPTKPEAGQDASHATKKKGGLPFHGKVAAVDTTAMTITVGQLTINVTSDTKISKDGKPATLSDVTVGEKVNGSYKKDDAGKLNATTIRIGDKAANSDSKKQDKSEKTDKAN
jgi:hypothetical protein